MKINMNEQNFFDEYSSTIDLDINISKQSTFKVYPYCKRFLDILFSIIGLLISVPFIIVFGILIKTNSKGPIFYFQERVGLNGKYFQVIKLRSMTIDAEKNGAQWALKGDPRITRVGAFIRKTRIDELPQFINILKGDMSLIGPRPERPIFTAQFSEEIPGFISRLKVRPGLTGWAQVNGGYDISPEEKLKLDMYYINNQNFLLDCKIIIRTILVIFSGNGAR